MNTRAPRGVDVISSESLIAVAPGGDGTTGAGGAAGGTAAPEPAAVATTGGGAVAEPGALIAASAADVGRVVVLGTRVGPCALATVAGLPLFVRFGRTTNAYHPAIAIAASDNSPSANHGHRGLAAGKGGDTCAGDGPVRGAELCIAGCGATGEVGDATSDGGVGVSLPGMAPGSGSLGS
jgi:hypothetical protein